MGKSPSLELEVFDLRDHQVFGRSGKIAGWLRAEVGPSGSFRLKDRPIGLMHVPKTAGRSLRIALINALKTHSAVQGLDTDSFGDFRDFGTFSDKNRSQIFRDGLPCSSLYLGHFSLSTLLGAPNCPQIISVFREPRSRILSLWAYWRSLPDQVLSGWGGWGDRIKLARLPLLDFLQHPSVSCQVDNILVRTLLASDPGIPIDGPIPIECDKRLLARATKSLHRLSFVDFVENSEFETNLSKWLQSKVTMPLINETKPSSDHPIDYSRELTYSTLEELSKKSRLDYKLWKSIVCTRRPDLDVRSLEDHAMLKTTLRHASLYRR